MRKKRCIHDIIYCILGTLKNGDKCISDILHECKLDTRTIQKALTILEHGGFITKKFGNGKIMISITEKGVKLHELLNHVNNELKNLNIIIVEECHL